MRGIMVNEGTDTVIEDCTFRDTTKDEEIEIDKYLASLRRAQPFWDDVNKQFPDHIRMLIGFVVVAFLVGLLIGKHILS